MIWHDASCLANHGHLVFIVHTLYDPAIHLTDEECKIKTGKSVNVQSIIEKPELYIAARCKSNDEQLAYVKTRTACMLDLRDNLSIEGIDICDRVRLFKGDGPAVQLESGQQKGGLLLLCLWYTFRTGHRTGSRLSVPPNDYRRKTTESACRSVR